MTDNNNTMTPSTEGQTEKGNRYSNTSLPDYATAHPVHKTESDYDIIDRDSVIGAVPFVPSKDLIGEDYLTKRANNMVNTTDRNTDADYYNIINGGSDVAPLKHEHLTQKDSVQAGGEFHDNNLQEVEEDSAVYATIDDELGDTVTNQDQGKGVVFQTHKPIKNVHSYVNVEPQVEPKEGPVPDSRIEDDYATVDILDDHVPVIKTDKDNVEVTHDQITSHDDVTDNEAPGVIIMEENTLYT